MFVEQRVPVLRSMKRGEANEQGTLTAKVFSVHNV